MKRWAKPATAAAVLSVLAYAGAIRAGTTFGAFSGSTSNGVNTSTAKRVFPGARVTSTWDIRDASGGGAESNQSAPQAFVDAITSTTGNWSSSFSATRYLEFDYNAPLPAGLTVTGAQFNFTFASNAATETACYYFEVRRASTSALIGTHGSSGSPLHCITTATQTSFSDSIASDVATSDVADDLRVRVYVRESGSAPIKVDAATVSGSTYSAFTLYRTVYNDRSTGAASSSTWGPVATDSASHTTVATWANSFSTTRYLKFTFPGYLPAGAAITNVTLTNSYKANSSTNPLCYYFDLILNGAAPITYGSTSSPWCTTSTSFVSQTHDLTADANTVAKANNVLVKMYMRISGGHTSMHDVVTLSITYSLD